MAKEDPKQPKAPVRKATGKPRPRKPAAAKKKATKTGSGAPANESALAARAAEPAPEATKAVPAMRSSARVQEGKEPRAEVGTTVINGVKAFSDTVILPGSSLIMDGDVKGGVLHATGGVLARAMWGPLGWLLLGVNSYSKSVSGKHLHEHLLDKRS